MRYRRSYGAHSIVLIISLVFAAVVAVPVRAQYQGPRVLDEPATVIAHLPMQGAGVTRIHLTQRSGRNYLYLETTGKPGIIVVDVTRAENPAVVNHADWPADASGGSLETVGHGLAVAESAPDASAVPRAINVLDISHPKNPRVIQTFNGVTAFKVSTDSNLVFFANGEGLWILKQHWAQPPVYPCSTSAVLTPNPNCE
jgi:hypothetical protein